MMPMTTMMISERSMVPAVDSNFQMVNSDMVLFLNFEQKIYVEIDLGFDYN